MLCQMCGQHPATTHIKTIVNGKLTQAHLCADWREKTGLRQFVRRLGLRLRQPAQRLYGQRRPPPGR